MADTFTLSGSIEVTPASGSPSGDPEITVPLEEALTLKRKKVDTYELDTDTPEAVSLGDMAAAHVVVIRARGGKVRVRYTTTDGAAQAVPADPLHVMISTSVGVTALDLTRVAGGGTVTVKVTLGEKA